MQVTWEPVDQAGLLLPDLNGGVVNATTRSLNQRHLHSHLGPFLSTESDHD
jgi:hypothetical protein